ncbi:MAG: hypothetical protein ACXWIQ_18135, partial [Caldimonas sp.]
PMSSATIRSHSPSVTLCFNFLLCTHHMQRKAAVSFLTSNSECRCLENSVANSVASGRQDKMG